MARLHTYATVFCGSGEVTCQPFPPVRGFGILSAVSHEKSYTVIVEGPMSSNAFHSMDCMNVCLEDVLTGMLKDRLEADRFHFSWACPCRSSSQRAERLEELENL